MVLYKKGGFQPQVTKLVFRRRLEGRLNSSGPASQSQINDFSIKAFSSRSQPERMASLLFRSFAAPQCPACTRRISALGLGEWHISRQQVRGKKRLANGASVMTVRLTRDKKGFGRKGKEFTKHMFRF